MAKTVIIRELPSNNPLDYRSAEYATTIENGRIVKLTPKADNHLEVWDAAVAAITDDLWVVTGVELMYEETPRKWLRDFENEAGKPFRTERVQDGFILGISVDGFDFAANENTDAVAGAYVLHTASNLKPKLKKAAPATGERVIGRVLNVTTDHNSKIVHVAFSNPKVV